MGAINEGYRNYRLENWDWHDEYRRKMGKEAFDKYESSVYLFIHKMNPKSFFRIDKVVTSENIDLFIKIVCKFILENPDRDILFSEDYTKVISYEQ